MEEEKNKTEMNVTEKAKDETVKVPKVNFLSSLLKFSSWLTGIIVSLMMGFAMIEKYIIIPDIPVEIVIVAGWAVIVVTVLNVILVFFKKK
jgi:hypothetical protein